MISRTTGRFRKAYRQLPAPIRKQAKEAYKLFQQNPATPAYASSKSIRPAPFILSAPVWITARLGYEKKILSFGFGLAHTQTMTNCSRKCDK